MNILFGYNSSWYVLFFGFLAAWAVLRFVRRKGSAKQEVKEQLFLATSGMMALALMEFFAVSNGLWSYTPGNWPVILWPTYFTAILFGYQLLRSIESMILRRPIV
jgi:fatty acid desaturase